MFETIRYFSIAMILKTFSSTGFSRILYGKLRDLFCQKKHSIVTQVDVERGLWICKTIDNFGLCLDDESSVLELGTGWTHFYGIFLRLFYDSKIFLFDIQDNRQFQSLKNRVLELSQILSHLPNLKKRLHLVDFVSSAKSFEDIYGALRMNYVLEQNGNLDVFNDDQFELVFSVDVLEHVDSDLLGGMISNINRILKPGGLSIHQVGVDDHLSHYVPGMSSKNYLRYSDTIWKLLFESKLQYINRIQSIDICNAFKNAGFQALEIRTEKDTNCLSQISYNPRFTGNDIEDLMVTRACMVFRKPLV